MTRQVVLPASPDVQLLGGEVVMLKGLAALDAYRLLSEGIAVVRQRDGIPPSPRLQLTLAALKAAANTARTADMPDIADVRDEPSSRPLRSGQQVGVGEVADLFGVGLRQARRLAPSLGGHKKRSGEWVFDLGLVNAYIESERTA